MNCQRINCEKEAFYNPVLRLYAEGVDQFTPAILNLGICVDCAGSTNLEDYLLQETFNKIAFNIQMAGYRRPDLKLTKLHWMEISRADEERKKSGFYP